MNIPIEKRNDGTTKPYDEGDKVLYIPRDLLVGERSKMVQHKNLGVVSSKNEKFVFVKFIGESQKKGVLPTDLYPTHNRPDLEQIITDSLKK